MLNEIGNNNERYPQSSHNVVKSDNNSKKGNMFFDRIKPIIELLVITGGFIIGIWQLNYLAKQVKQQSQQIEEQNIWNKKDVTIQYAEKYTEEMKMVAHSLELLPDTTSIEKLLKNDKTQNNIKQLVAYFQILAVGIEKEYFDENIAKQILIPETIDLYHALIRLKYFEFRKTQEGDEVAFAFQNLAKKWQQLEEERIKSKY